MRVIEQSSLTVNGFNLNLLECKFTQSPPQTAAHTVLILTYWNVNMVVVPVSFFSKFVLILTYWNVNSGEILDLIYYYAVLILTYWNVNLEVFVLHSPIITF